MGSTWTNHYKHCQQKDQTNQTYLNVGSVALALLPVDVQAELLAHLADLRSALSEVNPGRLALLSLIHISCQVIQQLWAETETLLHIMSTDSDSSLSKDNLEKHLKYAGFGFLVIAIKTWRKNKLLLITVRGKMVSWSNHLTKQEFFVSCAKKVNLRSFAHRSATMINLDSELPLNNHCSVHFYVRVDWEFRPNTHQTFNYKK